MASQELGCFERGVAWYHEQFPPVVGAITCRGEFCPAYLYSEEAAPRIAAYRPDIKLLVCLRPPVEMIYSWYWYNRNAVVASLPESFEEMMENLFLRDLGCFARHLRPYLDRFPAKNILVVQFDAIRRDPDRVRQGVYKFLNVTADFKPQFEAEKNPARAPRFPLLQSGAQRLYSGLSALPGVRKLLKSPAIAKKLQDVYHWVNTKARSTSRSRRASALNGRRITPPTRKNSPTCCGAFRLSTEARRVIGSSRFHAYDPQKS